MAVVKLIKTICPTSSGAFGVETSGDVIKIAFKERLDGCRAIYVQGIT